ncbi:MAG: 2-hydroxyacid dehydrogenase [Chloroflexi bacterium]|nr:2-hydroxyacid dehydrogenase [Chloroflexota bacterium]OJV92767.1 MAG: hypothetical protein BGO39_29835 [Chloroflexi bacterium 54-19]
MPYRILTVLDNTDTARLMHELLTGKAAEFGLDLQTVTLDRGGKAGLSDEPPIAEFAGRPGQLISEMPGTDILLVHLGPVSQAMLANAPDLKLIGVGRSGPVNIDVAAATERGIPVVFAPGRNADAVADFTFALLLAVGRRLVPGAKLVRNGAWYDNTYQKTRLLGPELGGRTLGVIGAGDIGRRVIRRATGFDMRILAHDPYLPAEVIAASGATPVSLEELLAQSDYLTLHARPNPDGSPLLGKAEFEKIKPGAILVNTARGALLDEDALAEALASGRLGGAGLDVLQEEPVSPDNPILKLPNVLVTPHIAGYSSDMGRRAAEMIVEDVLRFVKGQEPLRRVKVEIQA